MLGEQSDVQNLYLRRASQDIEAADSISVTENNLITRFGILRSIMRMLSVKLEFQKCFTLFGTPWNERQFQGPSAGVHFAQEGFVFGGDLTEGDRHQLCLTTRVKK